jgi:hypothetical protein
MKSASASQPGRFLVRPARASTWRWKDCLRHSAAGPNGNRYGDPAGHTSLAIAGTAERAVTLDTGSSDRLPNMRAFAAAALELLAGSLGH